MKTCHLQDNNNSTLPKNKTIFFLIAVRTRQTIMLKHPTKNNKDKLKKTKIETTKTAHHDKTNKQTHKHKVVAMAVVVLVGLSSSASVN